MGDKRIPISEKNRERLKERKVSDDTYDDVLEKLLDGNRKEDTARTIVAEIRDELGIEGDADLSNIIREDVGEMQDPDAFAREVAKQFDYAMLADQVAERVLREVQG